METKKPSHEGLVYAKFFIHRNSFFSNARRLLIIKSNCLTLNNLKTPSVPDETFWFKDILSIDILSNNEREFSLKIRKDTTITLQCSLRALCISEIYRALDRYNLSIATDMSSTSIIPPEDSTAPLRTRVFQTVTADGRIVIEADITIYRAHLELEYKRMESLGPGSKPPKHLFWEELSSDCNLSPKITTVFFVHIQTLYKTAKGIAIKTRDSHHIYELVVPALDYKTEIFNKIQQNCKQYTHSTLETQEDLPREDQYLFSTDAKRSSRFTETMEEYRKSNLFLRSNTTPLAHEYLSFKGSAYSGSVDSPKTFEYIKQLQSSSNKQGGQPAKDKDSLNFDLLQLNSPKYSFTPKNDSDMKFLKFSQSSENKSFLNPAPSNGLESTHGFSLNIKSPMNFDRTDFAVNKPFSLANSPYNANESNLSPLYHLSKFSKDSGQRTPNKQSQALSGPFSYEDSGMGLKHAQTFSSFLGGRSLYSSARGMAASKSHYDSYASIYGNPFMNIDTTILDKAFLAYYKVYKVFEDGRVFPVVLGLSENNLYELEFRSWLVLQKYCSSAIEYISQPLDLSRVELVFKDTVTVTYIVIGEKLEALLYNLLMLVTEQRSTSSVFFLQSGFVHSSTPRDSLKIRAWPEPEIDLDYQLNLIKQFCTAQEEKQFYTALQAFSLNGNLRAYSDREPKPLELLMKLLSTNIKLLRKKRCLALWKNIQDQAQMSEQVYVERATMSLSKNMLISEKSDQSPTSHTSKDSLTVISENDSLNRNTSMKLTSDKLLTALVKSEEILKAMIVLFSSKTYFKEITRSGRSVPVYEEFLVNIMSLLDCPYRAMSQLASSFMRAFIYFHGSPERKIERLNKKLLLCTRINLMDYLSRVFLEKLLVVRTSNESTAYHSVYASLLILKELVCENMSSMDSDDQKLIFHYLSQPFFFAIFNALAKFPLISTLYITTIIMISLLQNCENPARVKLMQKRCLHNSTTIPLHIAQILSAASRYQRRASLTLLYCIVKDNSDALLLITRVFPGYMFKLVEDAPNELINWTFADWSRFFITVKKDISTPNEQWDQKCRDELTLTLVKLDQEISAKYAKCPEDQIPEVLDLKSGDQGEFLINIRWNFEDFEVKYSTLEAKTKVDKYYLDGLLEDGLEPHLKVDILNPQNFWNELSIYLMNAQFKSDVEKTLKVMILVYTKYYREIGELRNMSSYLKSLMDPFYQENRYLLVQLIYVAVSLDVVSIANRNIHLFMMDKGLSTLAMNINSSFFIENHNNETNDDDMEINMFEPVENLVSNYTKLSTPKQNSKASFKDSNTIFFILNIFRIILKQHKVLEKSMEIRHKTLYPLPAAKQQTIEESVLKCLVNVLLLSDDELVIELLDLLSEYILDINTEELLVKHTPFIDFLLFNINSRTVVTRFSVVLQLYKIISRKFTDDQNPILIYINSHSDMVTSKFNQEAVRLFPVFKYLPKYMVSTLIIQGVHEFSQIFFSGSHESPNMIWNTTMRQSLQQSLNIHCQAYKQELLDYRAALNNYSKEEMPVYVPKPNEDLYPNIEVITHPIYPA